MDPDGQGPRPERASLHETIVENLFDGVYYVDRDRTITYWNPAAERISGFGAGEVVGRRCFDDILGHVNARGDRLCLAGCPLVQAMAGRRGVEAEVFLHHKDGHRVPVHVRCQPVTAPDGSVVGAVEIFNEDDAYRTALDRIDDLERLSSTDGLTGLPNRRTGEMALRARLRDVREAGWPLSVLFVDIDDFKWFNDTHGHAVGDDVLRIVGRSIAASVRASDLVARWGGEEFLVVSAASDREQVAALAERIRVLIAASSTSVDGRDVGVKASIGTTLAVPQDTAEGVVARADRAMYLSKAAGRDRTTFLGAEAAPR